MGPDGVRWKEGLGGRGGGGGGMASKRAARSSTEGGRGTGGGSAPMGDSSSSRTAALRAAGGASKSELGAGGAGGGLGTTRRGSASASASGSGSGTRTSAGRGGGVVRRGGGTEAITRVRVVREGGLVLEGPLTGREFRWPADAAPLDPGSEYEIILMSQSSDTRQATVKFMPAQVSAATAAAPPTLIRVED